MLKIRRRPSFKDRMMAFVKAKDEAGAAAALEGLEEVPGEDEMTTGLGGAGDTHVHLHVGGSEPAETADESAEGEGEKAPPWFSKHVESSDKRFTDIESGLAGVMAKLNQTADEKADPDPDAENDPDATTRDELEREPDGTKVLDAELDDPNGEKDPLKSEDKKTRDAAMSAEYRDIASKAEIIIPGVKLATLDSMAADPVKNLCLLRRRILYRATRDSARATVSASILGKTPDLAGMSCAAVKTAFNALAEVARTTNNAQVRAATSDGAGFVPRLTMPGATKSMASQIKDINAKAKDFWKERGV